MQLSNLATQATSFGNRWYSAGFGIWMNVINTQGKLARPVLDRCGNNIFQLLNHSFFLFHQHIIINF